MPFIGPKPADTVIDSSLIDDGTITTADLADSAVTKAKLNSDAKTNTADLGTEGTKVAVGTTAQRGSTQGQVRYNITTKSLEIYNGSTFDSVTPAPSLTSVSPTTVSTDSNVTFTITGSNFRTGDIISFVATNSSTFNASTTTVNSNSSITAVVAGSNFSNTLDPYDVKITSNAGQTAELSNQINRDTAPTWTTAAGNIATIDDNGDATHATIAATDADGDTITYAETGSNLTGAGLSLNTSNGQITGEPNNVSNATTLSFDATATANSQTVSRTFNIIINPALDGTSSARAAPSAKYLRDTIGLGTAATTNDGTYWIKPSGQSTAYQLYCILDTRWDGGGWVKVGQILGNSNFTLTNGTSWESQGNYEQNLNAPGGNSLAPTDFCKAIHISTNTGGGDRIIAGYQHTSTKYWLGLKSGADGTLDEVWDTTCFRGGTQSGSGSGFSTVNYQSGFTVPSITTNYQGSTAAVGSTARTFSAALAMGVWDTHFIKTKAGQHPNAFGMNMDGSGSANSNHSGLYFVR